MEYEKKILLLINTLLDNKYYYSSPSSCVRKGIENFNNLIKSPISAKGIQEFLNLKESFFILELKEIKNISLFLNMPESDKNEKIFSSLANSVGLNKGILLKEFKRVSIMPNDVCINHFDSIIIDKKFLNSAGSSNIKERIKPLESLALKLKNEGLYVPNMNLVFQYDDSPTDLINQYGYFKTAKSESKLFVNSNTFDSSSFYHEYFHAMDYELYRLFAVNHETKLAFSDTESYQGNELKEYRNFIDNYDLNNSTPEQTKNNLSLYFKTHFRSYFSKLNLKEITDSHLIAELDNMNPEGIFRVQEKNEVVEELKQHIQYALGSGIKPNKTLFYTFSKLADLDNKVDYYSKNSEKLARIYQSQFHDPSIGKRWASKILPEGSEYDNLVPALNQIIKEEFKPILQRHNTLNNILKLRNDSLGKEEKDIYQLKA